MFSRPSRFDRGVQGQKVGLPGDLLDDPNLSRNLLHRRHGLADGLTAVSGVFRRLQGDLLGLLSVIGVLFDVAGHLLHGRGDLLRRGGLLGRAL